MTDLSACQVSTLRQDGEFVIARAQDDDAQTCWLVVFPVRDEPLAATFEKLDRPLALRSELDSSWATRPIELVTFGGRPALLLEDPGGQFLDDLIEGPMALPAFLRIAAGIARAVACLHARGLVHKDLKPANVIVNAPLTEVWLTGFGLTSRLPRHRQPPDPPEIIAGTLAYMAPEQTGRMNRSIDSRSDLYSMGVTLYEMLTGRLPFMATDPMEWVHCHTARQPSPPSEHVERLPRTVSAIITRLLAKTPEERYQSAAGVESDLRRCLSEWEDSGHVSDFMPGQNDNPDRLLIPEKLYGRDRDVATLIDSFDRVMAGGRPELVLVSGFSGIGKSAVVNELHKALVPPRGLFASGKFDQYKRDIPFATLAQAFQSLVRHLLQTSEEELGAWRDSLREAVGPNGALLVQLVPELLHILGEQPPVPQLPPRDEQARFQLLMRRFIAVFARPEHPLALFLDDLQWLDAATLDLIEDLLSGTDLHHLLLIGAYRDNEVDANHPLIKKLETMRNAGSALHDIVLAPLGRTDLQQLLSDSLRCDGDRAAPLADLIHHKTSGNPFFAIQLITALADEAILTFDHAAGCWSWDLAQIHAKDYTDNVVDLMVGKLGRLPLQARNALQQLACLGNSAAFTVLQLVLEVAHDELHVHLWEAVRDGLVMRTDTSYHFIHDRVQEAAYSLIPPQLRAQAHLRIGRILARHTAPDGRDGAIFEVVNQLNRGLHLVTSAEERESIAGLDLVAARTAKLSTAYVTAQNYLSAARSLITPATWERDYDLAFSIECLAAECDLLTAEMVHAEGRLTMLAQRARTRHDIAVVTRLQLTLYTTQGRSQLAIDVFLRYLRGGGTDWSHHPSRSDVMVEYERIWAMLGNRPIEDLADLPVLTDPDVFDMLNVFTEVVHPAMFYDENLSSLAVCRMVSLSLEHGNCDASCFGYVWFAMFAGPRFNNYKEGFRFGQLGYDLVEKGRFPLHRARTFITFSTLMPWAKPAAQARELIRRAYEVACQTGDLTYSAYSWHVLITNHLTVGDPLAVVQAEAQQGLAFATKQGFGLVVANCATSLGLIRTLRGFTQRLGCFDDHTYSEAAAESHYAANPALVLSEFFYWTRKLQGRFIGGDYAAAVDAASRADRLLWTAASQVETGDYRFYAALAHAAAWNDAAPDEKPKHLERVLEHNRQLAVWAELCPANFENRAALGSAELARIDGRTLEAQALYEHAVQAAHDSGAAHHEAIANEVAARFYRGRGLATIADAYLRNARACYELWGAQGKVRQIDSSSAQPRGAVSAVVPTATIDTILTQMDAHAVMKASRALSNETNLPSLIEKLLQLAVQHAGAQRGLLILLAGGSPYIRAEATSRQGGVEITMRNDRAAPTDLPLSTLRYVLRTRERVSLGDASSGDGPSDDEYVRRNHPRSLLCLPILNQSKLVGALYLENSLASHAFTSERTAVLDVLASQAAISLENAALLTDVQLQLGLLQNLPVSAWTLKLDGTPDFANRVWLEFSGQALAFVQSHPEAWMSAIHPDDRAAASQAFWDGVRSGQGFAFETRSLRALDGTYRWHLQQAVVLRDPQGRPLKFIGTTTDIDDQKRTEDALRQAHAELAHVTRVTTLGELTASIAHEVNQPISGVVINASACLRRLSRIKEDSADLREARAMLHRIIRDGNRAGEIIARIRSLFQKEQTARQPLDLNKAIRGIVVLARHEINKQSVAMRVELAPGPAYVLGDRVQLQQVLLNLILNAVEAMASIEGRPRDLVIATQGTNGRDVQVTVRDSGIGLAPENMRHVFTAFYSTKSGGLGMGLAISRSIVENHAGRLWVTGHDGPGASFHFSLPAHTLAESGPPAHSPGSL